MKALTIVVLAMLAESYIPAASANRKRSAALLEAIAKRFGYVDATPRPTTPKPTNETGYIVWTEPDH